MCHYGPVWRLYGICAFWALSGSHFGDVFGLPDELIIYRGLQRNKKTKKCCKRGNAKRWETGRIECAAKGGSRRRPESLLSYTGLRFNKKTEKCRNRWNAKSGRQSAYPVPPKGVPGGGQNWDLVGNSMTFALPFGARIAGYMPDASRVLGPLSTHGKRWR